MKSILYMYEDDRKLINFMNKYYDNSNVLFNKDFLYILKFG